ncbi:hypothetical protein MASR1M66_05840 [Aminivibrio sp.]
MAIVYQKNKKTEITYVYQNEPYWDKEKRQSRAKRTLIGKLDPETGEIIPTRTYKKKDKKAADMPLKRGPVPITKIQRSFFGASYLLDQIGAMTGVKEDLKFCFPENYKQILSVLLPDFRGEQLAQPLLSLATSAYPSPMGMTCPHKEAASSFNPSTKRGEWLSLKNKASAYREGILGFRHHLNFQLFRDALPGEEGRNKEHDHLPQINLALLFGEESGLPFYYRKLPVISPM